ANSVSDVYAMGGRPVTALSIVGFPIDDLDGGIMELMLKGGIEKLKEAGCVVLGGHSINDEEIKLGFAVTGLISTGGEIPRDNARPGDVLVITKPLGTGMVSFAAQIGRIDEECLNEVGMSMAELNRDAGELMVRHHANACTDITGFGLMGHLVEMVRRSGVTAEIDMSILPVFESAVYCLENDILTGGIERNQEYSMGWVVVEGAKDESYLPLLYDPQTSGGLLISLRENYAEVFVSEMLKLGHTATSIVGRVLENAHGEYDGRVVVTNTKLENLMGRKVTVKANNDRPGPLKQESQPEETACCAPAATAPACCASSIEREDITDEAKATFMDFMHLVSEGGLIDARAKKLMAIALSISQRCKPCLESHIKSALQMKISQAEIEEAAYLAIGFCGAPGMMFYNETVEKIDM
ncbi:selenide, water dikinase SelD, partial [Candidatus Hydrogenedentota bacterium]